MTETVLLYLYPFVSTLGFAGYLPQIKNLIFAQKSPTEISIAMWLFWLSEQFITAGYGWVHLHDLLFVTLCLADVALLGTILVLTLYMRHVRFADGKGLALAMPFAPTLRSLFAASN